MNQDNTIVKLQYQLIDRQKRIMQDAEKLDYFVKQRMKDVNELVNLEFKIKNLEYELQNTRSTKCLFTRCLTYLSRLFVGK